MADKVVIPIKLKTGTEEAILNGELRVGELALATDAKRWYYTDGVSKHLVGEAYIDVESNMPASGVKGAIFFGEDTGKLYIGNALSQWVPTQYVTQTELTTTSGYLVNYMDTISGTLRNYASRSPMLIDVGPYSPYTTIQSAIDSITVEDYDFDWYIVRIFPGTYYEDVLMKDNVDVLGLNYNCVIEGSVSWPADRCTEGRWSSLHNLAVTAYPTASGAFSMLYSEAGKHDLVNSWFYMQVDVDGPEVTYLDIQGGNFHSYLSEWEIWLNNPGVEGVTQRGIAVTSGTYTEISGDFLCNVASDYGDFISYSVVVNNPGNLIDLIGGRIHVNSTANYFNGSITAVKTGCEGESFRIQNTAVDIVALQGGTARYAYVDSAEIGALSATLLSHANRVNITGFDFNYSCYCGRNADLWVSHFDSINAQDGFLGNPESLAVVHSDAYGELHLNKFIEFSPSSSIGQDRDIIRVDIGQSTIPVLKYQFYQDYPRLIWYNPGGASSFSSQSHLELANLSSAVIGDGAFDYDAQLTLRQDTEASGIRRWRIKSQAGEGDLIIDHYRTTNSGAGTPVTFRQGYEGMTSLRYGVPVDRFLNESDMASYSQYALPTQKSVVDYVDTVSGSVIDYTDNTIARAEAQFTEYVNAYIKPYRYLSVSVSGGDFQSIQEAVDSITITDFDTEFWAIQVHPGIYYEDVYLKDNVDLVGDSYDACIIDGSVNWLAASGCNAGYWSALQNLTVQKTTTTSGFCTICCDGGNHDIVNSYVWLTTEGVGGNCVLMEGGNISSYLTMYEYTHTGDTSSDTEDNHRCVRGLGGSYTSQSDSYVMDIEDTTPNRTVTIITQRSLDTEDKTVVISASIDITLALGFAGTVQIFRIRGGSTANSVNGTKMHIQSLGGGTAYGYYVDSQEVGALTSRVYSTANRVTLLGFDTDYFAHVGTQDYFGSHFDDIISTYGVQGSIANYQMVSSEVDGQLRITDFLKIGRGTPGEHRLIEVDMGQGVNNPELHFNGDYYGYTQGAFTTATGMGSFIIQTASGHALAGSMVYGPDAHNYEPRMSLWTHNSTNDDRHAYRLRKKHQDESFAISRLWTFQHDADADAENFVDVLNITKDGGFKLRYGPRVDTIFDEDDFASNSASGICTQQSIKAYVDAAVGTPIHNNLSNLQGGETNEYYHLTFEDYTTVTGGGYLLKPEVLTPATATKITYDQYGLVVGSTDATTADITSVSGYRYITDIEKTTYKYSLNTGLISGGILSKNVNNVDVDITAGKSLYVTFDNADDPTVEILEWPAQTISGGLSAEVGRLWIGIERSGAGAANFVKTSNFTHLQKRTIAIVGRIWSNGSDVIEGVGQYTTSAFGMDYALIDLIQSLGSLNRSGNIFTPTASGGLRLDKTTGESFRFSANFAGEPTAPNVHTNASMVNISAYHYHYYNAPTTVLTSYVDPAQYDVNGTLTAVPSGNFTIQRIHYYPKSDVIDLVYGQVLYNTLSDAELHVTTESVQIDGINAASLYGSILRGYLIVDGSTTTLLDTNKAKIITTSNFGSAGSSSAVGGITVHNQLLEIQGGATDDYQHLTTAQVAAFTATSGDIVSWVTQNHPTYIQLTTTSGDIISWVTNQDYVIPATLTTTSGDIISWVTGEDYATHTDLTTTSGDIVAQMGGKSHSSLLNLDADDHPQYPMWSANETISGNWTINTHLGFNASTNASPTDGDRWVQSDKDFRVRSNGVTLVDGMNSMVQCRQDSAVARQDCNTSAGVAVNWNIEDFEDYGLYGHSTSTNTSRITVSGTAWYKISYSVSYESQNSLRKNIATQLRKNGTTMMVPGRCNSFAYNLVDANGTNYASSVHRLAAGDYIEVMASGIGSTGQALTTQLGGTYITVEFIRWGL
jgi:hypothetical protein